MLSDRLLLTRRTTHTSELTLRCAGAVLFALLGILLPAGSAIEWLASCETDAPAEETAESTEAAITIRPVCQPVANMARAHDATVAPNPNVGSCQTARTIYGPGHRLANNLMAPMLC